MWFAILVTVLAASGNNVGKVLQKQATRTLPKLTLKKEVLALYFASPTWVAGMLTDVGGAVLMVVAFANAPVRWQKRTTGRQTASHHRHLGTAVKARVACLQMLAHAA
jgi:hypothetical protein